ncbi:MAG: hypothetical protein JKY31_13330 [Rhodobacteraceae bacterium]|nr:hypothetical protein [Paracoccaceae bacterium]
MAEKTTIVIVSTRAETRTEWQKSFDRTMVKHLSTSFMQSVLAWEVLPSSLAGLMRQMP